MTQQFRQEKDSMGVIDVPVDALWGAQTERSRQNFKIGADKMPVDFIRAFALLKQCAGEINGTLDVISDAHAAAIFTAAQSIIDGRHDDQFPLVIYQTGSGTQTNMNLNEVIANLANRHLPDGHPPIHPNDHVNASQSSNDAFPTAMHIAAAVALHEKLLPALKTFQTACDGIGEKYRDVIKVGRTHLQDATPITIAQEFSAFSQQLSFAMDRIHACLPRIHMLAQGGTAVGTGINCPLKFRELFANSVGEKTKIPFVISPNTFESNATHDTMVELSGVLNTIACSFMKIANDIRFLASGPRCGLGELLLPENEPGSSIMPGKVNPTQSEAMTMVAAQVMGNHTTVTVAGSNSHFQLNVFKPVIIYNILSSITLLSDAAENFVEKCLDGLTVNVEKTDENLEKSLMNVTILNPHIGYDNASKIAKHAHKNNTTLKQAGIDLGILTREQFDAWVDIKKMI